MYPQIAPTNCRIHAVAEASMRWDGPILVLEGLVGGFDGEEFDGAALAVAEGGDELAVDEELVS